MKNFRKNFLFLVSGLFLFCSCASSDIFSSIGNNIANPLAVAVDSNAARAYIVSSNNKVLYDTGSLQVLNIADINSPQLVGVTEIPSFSGHVYPDIAGGYLYVTNRQSSNNADIEDNILRVNINEASADFLKVESFNDGSNPFGIVYDAPSANLYVATSESALDYFPLGSPPSPIPSISMANLGLSDGTTLLASRFRDVAVIGNQAFLTRTGGGMVVVDLAEQNADYYISDITSPRAIVTDGALLYVTSEEITASGITPVLFVINPATLTSLTGNTTASSVDKDDSGILTATVTVGADPEEIALSINYIFVSNTGADTVTVINRTTDVPVQDITVGDEPFGMVIYSPGGVETNLFVTNIQSNTISVIDLASLSVITTY